MSTMTANDSIISRNEALVAFNDAYNDPNRREELIVKMKQVELETLQMERDWKFDRLDDRKPISQELLRKPFELIK